MRVRQFSAGGRGFAISAVWLSWPGADSLLRITVREHGGRCVPEAINHFRINAARARSLRVALAYALAEGNGAPEVMVEGERFGLGEALAFDAVLGDALRELDRAVDELAA